MLYIQHRVNSIEALKNVPRHYGVEIDLRTLHGELILEHDPFKEGTLFKEWLKHYHHALIILNVKEDGLEPAILSLLQEHDIDGYFFLDQPFPTIVKMIRQDNFNTAMRISEYETLDTALRVAGKVKWVWVDCFNHYAMTPAEYRLLKEKEFKFCLVSPELQPQTQIKGIEEAKNWLKENDFQFDAICTKKPDVWQE